MFGPDLSQNMQPDEPFRIRNWPLHGSISDQRSRIHNPGEEAPQLYLTVNGSTEFGPATQPLNTYT